MIPGSTHGRESAEWTSDARAQAPMARHHSRGALPTIGETVWSVAVWRDQWGRHGGSRARPCKAGCGIAESAGTFARRRGGSRGSPTTVAF